MSALDRRRRITAASPTPEKLTTFLRHLEESGSVSFAAERTGIGRNTVYELRKVDPAFARAPAGGLWPAWIANTTNTNRIEDALVSFLTCLKGPVYRRFFRGCFLKKRDFVQFGAIRVRKTDFAVMGARHFARSNLRA